ncbi:MAG TPA: hypothetical protein VFQ99_03375 [Gallionella sp.]|nr:hypothetical protein [Gallionella sp.]
MRFKFYIAVATLAVAAMLAGCSELSSNRRKVEYEQVVTVLKPIDKVPITVSFQDGVFYRVKVNNNLPTSINLVWDESAYVNTSGESVRIIRVLDRQNLPSNLELPQADSPIAPGSQLQADFAGESWVEFARRGGMPKPRDNFRKARIHLLFNINGRRVDWRGEVVFVPKKQP